MTYKGFIGVVCLWSLYLCLACTDSRHEYADRLNEISYAFHYKNLDSTYCYARKAFVASDNYSSGKAEALNNLAFVSIAKMDYDRAACQLDSVLELTNNQIELLIADVQYMRLCQRKAQNKEFYDYKERALQRLKRINEERDNLLPKDEKRLIYAETEYALVASTYYYYVGMFEQSLAELKSIDIEGLIQKDTSQYLNMLYQYGSGGLIHSKNRVETKQIEYEMLVECYLLSKKSGFVYWEANSMQAVSEHLTSLSDRAIILDNNRVSIGFLNSDNMPDSLLAGYLAQKSMEMFKDYGDEYQTAGSLRTLAACYREIGDNESALICLKKSLADKKIRQAPDLVASIYEQLSIVYSSMDDKYNSDVNRNLYLDLQDKTRQDMELDARASMLEQTSRTMNIMILVVIVLIICLSLLIYKLLQHRSADSTPYEFFDKLLLKSKSDNILLIRKLEDETEVAEDNISIAKLHLENNKRRNIENRSKVFLVNSVMPLIDRMANEVDKLMKRKERPQNREERITYISELSQTIEKYNSTLTDWIKLEQGEIYLKIVSFKLQDLFDIVNKSKTVFELQGISLVVEQTSVCVKADRVLTLFMINTIADNARKFTAPGGMVRIFAEEKDDYVEISIKDNGKGMSREELSCVFNRKVSDGHGFGLMNCKGILNKYRKSSKIFNVCELSAESEVGKGSRFFFKLPKGIVTALCLLMMPALGIANGSIYKFKHKNSDFDYCIKMAATYADSAYYSNVNASYSKTLEFTDSARIWLNRHYANTYKNGHEFMHRIGASTTNSPELKWFRMGIRTNYKIILDIRNESAIAALALHEWGLYEYNNSIYTKLFKEVYSDKSLGEYCRIMQQSETNKNIAIVLLVILLIALFMAAYTLYYRHAMKISSIKELKKRLENVVDCDKELKDKLSFLLGISDSITDKSIKEEFTKILSEYHSTVEQEYNLKDNLQILEDTLGKLNYEIDRLYVCNNILDNCLSTIKHETMYYPSRIYNYLESPDTKKRIARITLPDGLTKANTDLNELSALVNYYKELYGILCTQVEMQVGSYRFACSQINMSEYLKGCDLKTVGDKELFSYMFLIIKRMNKGVQPSYKYKAERGPYIKLYTSVPRGQRPGGVENPFVPNHANIPFLIIRQILREISNVTNLCGCGISAIESNGNIDITITLPRVISLQ